MWIKSQYRGVPFIVGIAPETIIEIIKLLIQQLS